MVLNDLTCWLDDDVLRPERDVDRSGLMLAHRLKEALPGRFVRCENGMGTSWVVHLFRRRKRPFTSAA